MASFALNRFPLSFLLSGILILLHSACSPPDEPASGHLFSRVEPAKSHISFSNTLTESDTLNYFTYPYIYMGGGIAVADFNQDGLQDVYFTGNMVDNKLYLNEGHLSFQDITNISGTQGDKRWMQGATICDINNDGWPDIYVSVSGQNEIGKNILFVNQGLNAEGIPTFKEEAEKYGIADIGHSTQSTFFDYDNDGDLDLYVANYPITSFKSPNFYYKQMLINAKHRDSDHLYKNNGDGTFSDVTEEAGILNFGLSLSATAADLNNDKWIDIYVSNDFASPDFVYMNNGDGTFSEKSKEVTQQTSFYGMGVDIADFNNDGLLDVLQVDMAPEDNRRSKENMSGMNRAAFYELIDLDLHYQYMYNALQINQGIDDQQLPHFSNIAKLAGLSSTDWSWAPLFADFDNDGFKDIFISNGTRRDINNNDYFNQLDADKEVYFGENSPIDKAQRLEKVNNIPSEAIPNYILRNRGDLTFENSHASWGLSEESFSNGAAYADFDNDGDLDLIINNIDQPAFLYENNANRGNNNFLRVKLEGPINNPLALSSRVEIWMEGKIQMTELTLTRGFQSSVDQVLHFGLGTHTEVDSLMVFWPGGAITREENIKSNQLLTFNINQAAPNTLARTSLPKTWFEEYKDTSATGIAHHENEFDDFNYQILLPHKMSNFGPALAKGDVNNDGLDDAYLGAAIGQNGVLLLQQKDGSFQEVEFQDESDLIFEDMDAVFVDVNGDQYQDLYIVSGGNEYEGNDPKYQDRLYINNHGVLERATSALPALYSSGACVRPFDFDNDGDMDLFVGARLDPRNYPYSGHSYLLENKSESGSLKFEERKWEDIAAVGMVTDAIWTDLNANGQIDLIVVGEWMPIKVFEFDGSNFTDQSSTYFDGNTTGWWYSIDKGDFDGDGDDDLVLGNLGLNYKYKASPDATFNLYANDFDKNGKTDIVLSYHNFGEEYPVRGRQCSSEQIPDIKNKFKDYQSYSQANVADVFGKKNLNESTLFEVESFKSIYLENNGNQTFTFHDLPSEAQLFPINDLLIDDFTGDKKLDIIVVGNLFASEVETPRSDAGIGLLLKGDGAGHFTPTAMAESGIFIPYDSKKIVPFNFAKNRGFIVANNNGPFSFYLSR